MDRKDYLDMSLARVTVVSAWLDGIPERNAAGLAATLDCSVETARAVLDELIAATRVDLGDIPAEVTAGIAAAQ